MAERLKGERLVPYLEEWELAPGQEFQPMLAEGLRDSKAYVVFLGPNSLGPWQKQELQVAIDRRARDEAFHVIPVLLPGAERPRRGDVAHLEFLINASWVEFLKTLDDEQAFRSLMPADAQPDLTTVRNLYDALRADESALDGYASPCARSRTTCGWSSRYFAHGSRRHEWLHPKHGLDNMVYVTVESLALDGRRSPEQPVRQVEIEQDGDHVRPGQCDRPGGDAGFQPQQPQHEGHGHPQDRGTRDAPADAA